MKKGKPQQRRSQQQRPQQQTSSAVPIVTAIPSSDTATIYVKSPDYYAETKRKRSCTDILFLFFFSSFAVGWAVLAGFSYKNGDPRILLNPTDSNGFVCGLQHFQDKPYLYFFDLMKCADPKVIVSGCPTAQVCVSKCPDENYVANKDTPKDKLICKFQTDMTKPIPDLLKDEQCAAYYLKSVPLVKRCIPTMFLGPISNGTITDASNRPMSVDGKEIVASVLQKAGKFLSLFLNTKDFADRIVSDLKASWKILLIALCVIMLLSLLWIVLMQWIAGIMIWISIVAVIALTGFGSYYTINKYVGMQAEEDTVSTSSALNFGNLLAQKKTWLVLAVISTIVFVVILLTVIFLRNRIRIAIALIHEASKAVSSMVSCLIFPFIPYLLQVTTIIFWGAVALYISSSGKASYVIAGNLKNSSSLKVGDVCDPRNFTMEGAKCQFRAYDSEENLYGGHVYNLFMMLWTVFFLIGLSEVALASAFSAYYWALHKPQDVPSFAVLTGFYRCLRYHMGSVALGSFLIATVRVIRIILEYISRKCKQYDNDFIKGIMWALKCCFWLLEKILIFISKNAYIMVAIQGTNFCTSAKDAFELIVRNAVRVVVLDKVTDFLLFIGKVTIVSIAAVGSFYLFNTDVKYTKGYVPTVNYIFIPVLIITVGAYFIATVFFNVYGTAVDTMFLCFLHDLEENDGSAQKPYYMSKELMKILHKTNTLRDPAAQA